MPQRWRAVKCPSHDNMGPRCYFEIQLQDRASLPHLPSPYMIQIKWPSPCWGVGPRASSTPVRPVIPIFFSTQPLFVSIYKCRANSIHTCQLARFGGRCWGIIHPHKHIYNVPWALSSLLMHINHEFSASLGNTSPCSSRHDPLVGLGPASILPWRGFSTPSPHSGKCG